MSEPRRAPSDSSDAAARFKQLSLFTGGSLSPQRFGVRRRLRQVARCWMFQLKILIIDPFSGFNEIWWPLFFASAALLVYRQTKDPNALAYAALGAAGIGTWSAIATSASFALQRERWFGALELLVATGTPLPVSLISITGAMATAGLYSLVATLLWGRFVFGIHFVIANPAVFALTIVATVLGLAMIGFLLAVTVVRYRTAWALGNLLEYPGWLICGFLVPVSLLPGWAQPIAKALAPTWGMAAMRNAAAGQSPWRNLAICLGLGVAAAIIGALAASWLLRSARNHATLALT
jgi:ABC-2 type transport system permease protein